jgi:signal peptidase I
MGNTPGAQPNVDESKNERPSALYTYGGGTLALLGGALLFYQRQSGNELPSWLYYTAVGALVLGIIEFGLGRMTRDAAHEWNKSLIFALTLALLIRWPIAEPYRIPSGSMETTLHGDPNFGKGDRVFVNKWIYGVRYPFMNKRIWNGKAPERWDIVVFKSVEPEAEHPTLVKRIVGMPGDHIHISGGNVYVDGEPLDIPDFKPDGQHYTSGFSMKYGVRPEPEFSQIPEGNYLVLGDNSDNSRDGRYFGWLPNEHIVGRVASIWWPPPRWRDFTGFSSTLWWNALLVLLATYIVVRLFVGRSWPTVNAARDGVDHVFINFLTHGFRIPMTTLNLHRWGTTKTGDTVLYRPVGDASKKTDLLLGRVVGTAGDEVVVDDGKLLVNGEDQSDAMGLGTPIAALDNGSHIYGKKGKGKSKTTVPEGEFFLLTDFHEDEEALDSREMGFVPESYVMGKAQCIWWPLRRAGRVK